jgi:hypothetical protein
VRRRDRLIYEPQKTREDAEALARMFATLLVKLALEDVYGVHIKHTAGRFGVFVGRHDDGRMPAPGSRDDDLLQLANARAR